MRSVQTEGGPAMRGLDALALVAALTLIATSAPVPWPNDRKAQEEAVGAIRKLGGTVRYDYQRIRDSSGRPYVYDLEAKPKDPDAFHRVVHVCLRDTKVADA